MNTARGNKHLANAKDYLYGVYTIVSVEEIMICAQEKGKRELCVRRKRTNTNRRKEKKGKILCRGGGKHSVERQ